MPDVKTFADGLTATWDPTQECGELEHGVTFAWLQGRSTAIQKFVEALSRKADYKVDWAYVGGRAHLDVLPQGLDAVDAAIRDEGFVRPFLVPYSERTWDDGTFLRIDVPDSYA